MCTHPVGATEANLIGTRRIRSGAIIASVVAAVAAFTPTTAAATDAAVSIGDNVYAPSSVTIDVGDTVTWTWGGSNNHSTTSDAGQSDSWDSGARRNGTFVHTFEIAGTFTYHCVIHSSMHGTVIVQGAGGATQYRNCRAMHRDWEHGVARSRAAARAEVRDGYGRPHVSRAIYRANRELDADDDGVACEA